MRPFQVADDELGVGKGNIVAALRVRTALVWHHSLCGDLLILGEWVALSSEGSYLMRKIWLSAKAPPNLYL
jgi:hypothetical protein